MTRADNVAFEEKYMAAPSTIDPWTEKGTPLDKQYRSWKQIVKEPVNKLDVEAYSRARIILMNGIEAECVLFSHAFARMTDNREILALLLEGGREAELAALAHTLVTSFRDAGMTQGALEAFTYLRARTLVGEGNLTSDDVVAVRHYFEDLRQRPNARFVIPE